jgi:hypothetical protein
LNSLESIPISWVSASGTTNSGSFSGCIRARSPAPKRREKIAGNTIKELIIYLPVNTAVTIVVTGEEKPEVEEQHDHWEDERQQMLDDYD